MSESPSEFVTLVASDGHEFILKREIAYGSGAIKRMLDPNSKFSEALTGRCHFATISGAVMEKVCEYLLYKEKYKHSKEVPDMDIPPELCLELLMAADYLNV